MNKFLLLLLFGGAVLWMSVVVIPAFNWEGTNTSVYDVLQQLGDETKLPKPKQVDKKVSIAAGQGIVLYGNAKGKKGSPQSKHFVCTSCHNIQKEDPDLSVADPQARLEYARDNELPFLPGTTLYGAVNRTSFYNGDYEKKYGSLVTPARNNIREAIQLCAVECSQGRALKEWELESVLAYLWTLDLKLGDLNLTPDELKEVESVVNNGTNNTEMVDLLKSKYLKGAPATFVDPPPNRKEGYAYEGDPENGQLIYNLSCKHCHEKGRYAFFELDDSGYSFRFLKKHLTKYTRYSMYQVTRYGTSPLNGKRAYMPNYTKEKLNDQQIEDLRAYIESRAKNS